MSNLWTRWFYHPYSSMHVKARGRRDGDQQPPIPAWTQKEQPPYIKQLREAGDHDIRVLAHEWCEVDRRLKQGWLDTTRAAARADERVQRTGGALAAAEARYKAKHSVDAPAGGDHRFLWYWLLILLLLLFEFPMNSIVFQLFGENEILTLVATGGLALTQLVCAHWLGVFLRKGEFHDHRHRAILAFCIAVPVVVALMVAYFRIVYLAHTGDVSGGVSVGQWLGSGPSWIAFAAMNLLVFGAAAVGSFHVHDDELIAVHRARRAQQESQRRLESVERTLARLQAVREERWEQYHHRAAQVTDIVHRLSELYRTHNLEHRGDRGETHETEQPVSFYECIDVTIPESLRTLDWDIADRAALFVAPKSTPTKPMPPAPHGAPESVRTAPTNGRVDPATAAIDGD